MLVGRQLLPMFATIGTFSTTTAIMTSQDDSDLPTTHQQDDLPISRATTMSMKQQLNSTSKIESPSNMVMNNNTIIKNQDMAIETEQQQQQQQQEITRILNFPDLPALNSSSTTTTVTLKGVMPQEGRGACAVNDKDVKFMLRSAPKAGCMQAVQLLISSLGKLEKALAKKPGNSFEAAANFYNQELRHDLRHSPSPKHMPLGPCAKQCQQDDWTCIKIIRNPLDRAVSSYIHTVKYNIWRAFFELHQATNQSSKVVGEDGEAKDNPMIRTATFEQFVNALELRALNVTNPKSSLDNHFLPQAEQQGCDESMDYVIPLETTDIGLHMINEERNLTLPTSKNISSSHYIQKDTNATTSDLPDASQIPLVVPNLKRRPSSMVVETKNIYPYDAYYQNPTVSEKVCRLFYIDFQLYKRSCEQTVMKLQMKLATETSKSLSQEVAEQHLQIVQEACQKQWQRINNVCGTTFQILQELLPLS